MSPFPIAFFSPNPFDPGNNGFDIGDALDLCLVIAAIYGAIIAIAKGVRWWDAQKDRRHRLDVESILKPHLDALSDKVDMNLQAIIDRTTPIQPGENGGESLADVHTTLQKVVDTIDSIKATGEHTAARVEDLEEDQVKAQAERSKILVIADENYHALAKGIQALGGSVTYVTLAEYLSGPHEGATVDPTKET